MCCTGTTYAGRGMVLNACTAVQQMFPHAVSVKSEDGTFGEVNFFGAVLNLREESRYWHDRTA